MISLFTLLACGGAGPAPAPPVTPATAPEAPATAEAAAPTPAHATARVEAPDPNAGLGDHWLVIVGSKLVAAEVEPAVAAARASGVDSHPRTLLSSRFKNLSPCLTVGIADAFTDKAAALALSKALKGKGVDNYVKNAGAYVGPSAAIDRFCEGSPGVEGESVARVLSEADGALWLPLDVEVPEGLPSPRNVGQYSEAWVQTASLQKAGGVEMGASWRAVDVGTGREADCKVVGFAALTLGQPHFGMLEGGPLKEPACGGAAMFARLDCDASGGSSLWVAAPSATAGPVAWSSREAPELQAAGEALLNQSPEWTSVDPDVPSPQREVSVTRFEGPEEKLIAVVGAHSDDQGCGGDDYYVVSLHKATAEGGIGPRVGAVQKQSWAILTGLVDLEGDGQPELFWQSFPSEKLITRATGESVLSAQEAFCDCPC